MHLKVRGREALLEPVLDGGSGYFLRVGLTSSFFLGPLLNYLPRQEEDHYFLIKELSQLKSCPKSFGALLLQDTKARSRDVT